MWGMPDVIGVVFKRQFSLFGIINFPSIELYELNFPNIELYILIFFI